MVQKRTVWGLVTLLYGIAYIQEAGGQAEGENVSEADYYTMVITASGEQGVQNSDVQNAPHGYRPGSATTSNTCQHVRGVPSQLRSGRVMKPRGLTTFYQKYTEAYGIPVVASRRVPDNALRRACYTLRFLLASNRAVRNSFYSLSGRVAVIGKDEGTNWIPEHSNLPNWWNQRARGLGATPHQPVSSGGEENVLCYRNDRYRAQDIFLHESAHGVHLLGAAYGIPGWDRRLRALYNQARSRGLWRNTYSMSTPEEYFAEGTQSYFNVNSYAARPDGVRGPINTRTKLRTYDPQLYSMIREVFPCPNVYLKRCNSTRAMEDAQQLQMDCDVEGGGTTATTTVTTTTTGGENCMDSHRYCNYWASIGECDINPPYMLVNCQRSCRVCLSDCSDANQSCPYWANIGECDRNPSYMNVNCAFSCERC